LQKLVIKEEPQSNIALSVSLVVSDHFSVFTSDDIERHKKLFASSSDEYSTHVRHVAVLDKATSEHYLTLARGYVSLSAIALATFP